MTHTPKLVRCPKCGDPAPWHRDTCAALTTRHEACEKQAGEPLGIPVLDHVVLGDGERYYSFADQGQL